MPIGCLADDEMLIVKKKDGSTLSYVLSSKIELTFQNETMKIISGHNSEEVYISNILDYHFEKEPTAIDKVDSNEIRIVRNGNNELRIYGDTFVIKDVHVYDMNGKRIHAFYSLIDGCLLVSFTDCPNGAYIIKINNYTIIKIIKK